MCVYVSVWCSVCVCVCPGSGFFIQALRMELRSSCGVANTFTEVSSQLSLPLSKNIFAEPEPVGAESQVFGSCSHLDTATWNSPHMSKGNDPG